jgi:hypothetical protein
VKLNEAFSKQYPATRKQIRGISESLKQKWMEALNQKSNFYDATPP